MNESGMSFQMGPNWRSNVLPDQSLLLGGYRSLQFMDKPCSVETMVLSAECVTRSVGPSRVVTEVFRCHNTETCNQFERVNKSNKCY